MKLSANWIRAICGAAALLAASSNVRAHFLWVDATMDETGDETANLWFSESPTAGSVRLAKKLAAASAWLKTADSRQPLSLALSTNAEEETGGQAAAIDAAAPHAIEAVYEYGVFDHGDEPARLHYYARHIQADKPASLGVVPHSDELLLDIAPNVEGGEVVLTTLWHGKPLAGANLVIGDDEGKEVTADAQGQVRIALPANGRIVARASRVEADNSGELDGKKYAQTHYYATLTATVNEADLPDATAASSAQPPLSADELLERARNARAIWDEFPGFEADLTLFVDGQSRQGQVKVTEDGEVVLSGFDGVDLGTVRPQLVSLIRHRLAGGGPGGAVVYQAEEGAHPLGVLVRFTDDPEMHSAYRVRDDVITEVNRAMGDSRFTISVLDVDRTPEGKYMPTTIQVSYWNRETGDLESSETHFTDWTRVGAFDLPRRLTIVRAIDKTRPVVQLEFTNHELREEGPGGRDQASTGAGR